MNIKFKLISRNNSLESRSNSLESRSNPSGSRSNLDYLLRILKLGALSCALVLTTFNSCEAMDENQYKAINYGYRHDRMEYLRKAMKELQNLKILETEMNNINDMDILT
ncbi:MAG: hypothetical protein IJU54_00005 [Alphaproteobacteria bacterium]|nr:hypothetical protein [Alphaproteobacteria bacterium]